MICPKCGWKAIAKVQGHRAAYATDGNTCQVIQQISQNELVVRIYKLYWSYTKGKMLPKNLRMKSCVSLSAAMMGKRQALNPTIMIAVMTV